MIHDLAKTATIITDTTGDEQYGTLEQPVIIEDHPGSDGVSVRGYDGDSIYIPYRLIKEVAKAMIAFTPKKQKDGK